MRLRAVLASAILRAIPDDAPRPAPPGRPIACPACHSGDIHGERPCPRRKDLEASPEKRDHDWHCHACWWSAPIGDGKSAGKFPAQRGPY